MDLQLWKSVPRVAAQMKMHGTDQARTEKAPITTDGTWSRMSAYDILAHTWGLVLDDEDPQARTWSGRSWGAMPPLSVRVCVCEPRACS